MSKFKDNTYYKHIEFEYVLYSKNKTIEIISDPKSQWHNTKIHSFDAIVFSCENNFIEQPVYKSELYQLLNKG